MDQQATTTLTAIEILRGYGKYHAHLDGTAQEVLHPVTGEWVLCSGGRSDTDNDQIILAVFTGQIEQVWDEYGEHTVPTFNATEAGGIVTTATTVLTVR